MLRSNLRSLRTFASCLPSRVCEAAGFWSGFGPPVQFVVERADWAIRSVGEHVRDEIEVISPGSMGTTISPQKVVRRIVHFGSQYMWLTWGQHMSQSNQYVASFFHGKPDDGPSVARHIDQFMKSVPALERVITGAGMIERRLLKWGVPREKLVRIPIGVDTTVFSPPDQKKRAFLRQQLNIPEHMIVVGSFQKDGEGWGEGRLPKLIKGPDIYVQVMVQLKLLGIPVMGLLTGPARGYVKEGLARNGIPFIHKYVANHRDLVPYYHVLDLYLVTSREEGGPMGLMESMASAVPVVSTPVGMAPDLIDDGRTGALAEECSTDAMVEKACSMLGLSSITLKRLKIDARTAVKVTDWSVVGPDHWFKVYKPLM
ncbi:MAG: glycosyltransferase family 4 protein [Burkholderiales bacterium]|nr:glycosyltransferase family 4 protein [Burkholderiales bacterium]